MPSSSSREQQQQDSSYLTVPQIAKELQLTPKTVYLWIRRGELVAHNFGSGGKAEYRVARLEYERFKQGRQVKQPPPDSTKDQEQEESPPDL